jgi:hypothetical protein
MLDALKEKKNRARSGEHPGSVGAVPFGKATGEEAVG